MLEGQVNCHVSLACQEGPVYRGPDDDLINSAYFSHLCIFQLIKVTIFVSFDSEQLLVIGEIDELFGGLLGEDEEHFLQVGGDHVADVELVYFVNQVVSDFVLVDVVAQYFFEGILFLLQVGRLLVVLVDNIGFDHAVVLVLGLIC